jgi:hypothetical protein
MTRAAFPPLHRGRQCGQSAVEFLVLAVVLVPLFLTIPLLGAYLDLAQTTEVAARYVAFEGTVANTASAWKSDATLAAEVRRRFFSRSDAPVKTGDTAGDFGGDRNPLWTDHAGNPLLARFGSDVSVATRSRANSAPAAAVLAGGSGFDLPRDNEYTAVVSVRPRNVAGLAPFDAIGLEIARSQTIVVDGWAAGSPDAVRHRVEDAGLAVYPIEPLRLLGEAFNPLIDGMLDPKIVVGDVKPEIVPCDRLEPGC